MNEDVVPVTNFIAISSDKHIDDVPKVSVCNLSDGFRQYDHGWAMPQWVDEYLEFRNKLKRRNKQIHALFLEKTDPIFLDKEGDCNGESNEKFLYDCLNGYRLLVARWNVFLISYGA